MRSALIFLGATFMGVGALMFVERPFFVDILFPLFTFYHIFLSEDGYFNRFFHSPTLLNSYFMIISIHQEKSRGFSFPIFQENHKCYEHDKDYQSILE